MPETTRARYAYLGPQGTFSEAAARTLPDAAQAELAPHGSVVSALEAVRAGHADGAVVPIENSVEGSVAVTLDELARGPQLMITDERHVDVQFALLARPGTALTGIRTVASHPHAVAQCRRWLAAHLPGAEVVPETSTDHAAAIVAGAASRFDPGSRSDAGPRSDAARYDAAIAAPIAADTYRLATLAEGIADRAGAVTRFVLVGRPGPPQEPTGADKTTVVAFIRHNRPGALLELVEQFSTRGIDLMRIESRPTGVALGEYCFSIDAAGHVAEGRMGEALMGLKRTCADVRFLGSYPRADGVSAPVPAGTTETDFTRAQSWLARLRS